MNSRYSSWLDSFEGAVSQTAALQGGRLDLLVSIAGLWLQAADFLREVGLTEFPEPALECAAASLESVSHATHGYYKSALAVLRQQIELSLSSCLFKQLPDQIPHVRAQYFESTHAPSWHRLKQVFDAAEFRDYARSMRSAGREDLAALAEESLVHDFYDVPLSKATHSVLATWNLLDWQFQLVPQYSAEAFDLWADSFEVIQGVALLWLCLTHPGMAASIESQAPTSWGDLLAPPQVDYLRSRGSSTA